MTLPSFASKADFESYSAPKIAAINEAYRINDQAAYDKVLSEIRADGHHDMATNVDGLYTQNGQLYTPEWVNAERSARTGNEPGA